MPASKLRPSVFVVGMLQAIKKRARPDFDEIVAEIGSKDSDAAALSIAECMAEAGLVGKVCCHNYL